MNAKDIKSCPCCKKSLGINPVLVKKISGSTDKTILVCEECYLSKFGTFPFEEDKLIDAYECQNQVYMDLTGADEWITASCLVNASEHMVNNEKLKWLYALQNKNGNPDNEEHPNYDEYLQKCREIEIMMIFDYDRFIELYPYHDMVIPRKDWFSKNYDIPLADKVIEKTSFYNHDKINELKKRITIAREYLNNLK